MTTAPKNLVLRFLASVGRPAEAQLYLSLFRAERPESFAVIVVDHDIAGVAADALAVDLEFLAELGLSPILAFESVAQAETMATWLGPASRAEVVPPAAAPEVARRGGIALVPIPADRDGDGELIALCREVATRKIVLLGADGALTRAGDPVSIVDVTTEWDDLVGPGALSPDHRALLHRARALLDGVDHPMTVAITSPLDLLRELFTVRGAGTLVRRGIPVSVHQGLKGVDRARLKALIESAFDRPLAPDYLDRPIERTYLAGDYRGAAIVAPTTEGPYLSKLAASAPARGEGIGRDLWRVLCRDYPAFYWRSRPENPIAPWYQDQCHGMIKAAPWHIFWRGLPEHRIAAATRIAREAPPDFE